MRYFLGYGLPSSLTPERIRKVLGFVRSQEREFQAVLDEGAAFVWTQTGRDGDFYERLHSLFRTAEGRAVYARARHSFEERKSKRSGRADLFDRLTRDCLQGALDQDSLAAAQDGNRGDVEGALAQAEAWKQLAEFAWARAAQRRVGDGIVDLLRDHPAVGPFLEEVRAGLVSINSPVEGPEEGGEAARLVENIRDIGKSLDA